MSVIERIEQDLKGLTQPGLAELRAWFDDYHAGAWDKQTEEDAKAGKLDRIAQAALAEHRAGKSREL